MVDNNSGYMLNNRYRLIDQIGEGGMANVYLAKDTILNRNVAVKVLRGDLSNDETFVRRFQREALAATALEHPNLVQVYDVGEEQGYHYIVMEYIEGKTLKQLIKQYGPLSVAETIDVMEQLVSAVEHAHSRHVIHRDIKPQNVIIRNDGTVKLTDFGIAVAKNAAQLTQTNSIMGSVHYLAPEIAKGQAATAQSDIYSLGILMFELLTGDVPFTGDSAVNIALMHMEDKIPSVRGIVGADDINQAIENIIIKATTKNKNLRYNSAHEMLVDLIDCQYRNDEAIYEVGDDRIDSDFENIEETKIVDKNQIAQATKKKRSKKPWIIGGIFAGLIIIGIIIFFAVNTSTKTGIKMPNIVNKSEKDAQAILNEHKIDDKNGFSINFKPMESENVDEGYVIETDPIADTELEKNQEITVSVSSGYKIEVPDVVGRYVNEAKATLENLGFKIIEQEEESDTIEEYKVISSSPKAGDSLKKGATITLNYAIKKTISMPDLKNFTYTSAYSKAEGLGLAPSTTNCLQDSIVIKQSIKPGAKVTSGKAIVFTCRIEDNSSNNSNSGGNDNSENSGTNNNQ